MESLVQQPQRYHITICMAIRKMHVGYLLSPHRTHRAWRTTPPIVVPFHGFCVLKIPRPLQDEAMGSNRGDQARRVLSTSNQCRQGCRGENL